MGGEPFKVAGDGLKVAAYPSKVRRLVERTGGAGESFGVVEIEDAAFFRGGEFVNFGAVGPDYRASADLEWRDEQFRKKLLRKNNWMATAPQKRGKNYGRARSIENRDEIVNQGGAD